MGGGGGNIRHNMMKIKLSGSALTCRLCNFFLGGFCKNKKIHFSVFVERRDGHDDGIESLGGDHLPAR